MTELSRDWKPPVNIGIGINFEQAYRDTSFISFYVFHGILSAEILTESVKKADPMQRSH